MPFFTGASDVIISGGTFNSIAGNSVYYATTGNIQNPLRNTDDHNTIIDNRRRPTVPDLEAARDDDDEESLKVPQRHRSTEKPHIIQERSDDPVPAGNKPSEGESPRSDSIEPEQPSPTEKLEGDEVEEWSCHIHPEGWYYFFRQHHNELDPENMIFHEIRGARETTNTTTAPKTGPARTLPEYGGLHVQTYVDHTRIFASEDKDALLKKCYTDEEANELQLQYWMLLKDYPSHNSLPPGAVIAAKQALHCHMMEGLWRKSDSRAPFTLAESKVLLEYLNLDEEDHKPEKNTKEPPVTIQVPSPSPLRTALVAWVLCNVAKHRKNTKYGCITFKEARDAEKIPDPGFVFMVISAACFFAPIDHRRYICAAKKSSDLHGDVETWPAYIDSLVKEWSTFNLAATVLLSASVGFLAVLGMDSVTRVIVLLSVVFTLGSIMTGVYLIWRHQHQRGGGRLEYFVSLLSTEAKIDGLAIILSTQFTFLAWGVLTFLVAVITYSFFGFQSTSDGRNIPVRGSGSILIIILGGLVVAAVLLSFIFFRSFRKRGISD